jgi:WD40 repeat protein
MTTGEELRTFTGHMDHVTSIAFSPDGHTALSGSYDKTLKLWEVPTGKELRTFTGHADQVLSVAFSPDGRTALSGSTDKTLKLWDMTKL